MIPDRELNALFGLKYNPFVPGIPPEYIWQPPGIDVFATRVESLLKYGGFAMISGEPGIGKSKSLQSLSTRLSRLNDVVVGENVAVLRENDSRTDSLHFPFIRDIIEKAEKRIIERIDVSANDLSFDDIDTDNRRFHPFHTSRNSGFSAVI